MTQLPEPIIQAIAYMAYLAHSKGKMDEARGYEVESMDDFIRVRIGEIERLLNSGTKIASKIDKPNPNG